MLKKILISIGLLFLFSFSYCQEITKILESDYESKMISSGKNYPTISTRKNNLKDICILLHHRVSLEDIREYFNWSEKELQTRLDLLFEEDLIKKDEEFGYLPTAMIISLKEGEKIKEETRKLVDRTCEMIIKVLPEIKKNYSELKGFRHIEFSRASLLILSNIMLDTGQIDNVEKMFLKTKRTPRNNMNYYYSFQENSKENKKEAFNIYGNSYQMYGNILNIIFGKGLLLGNYGNERERLNFNTLSKKQLHEWFGMKETEDIKSFKKKLLQELVKLSKKTDYKISDIHKKGFNKIGMLKGNLLTIPVFKKKDNKILNNIANLLTDDLIALLEENKGIFKNNYQNSLYSKEITFEEYFIWWYHFFYSEVTEKLIAKDLIQSPTSGVISYIYQYSIF